MTLYHLTAAALDDLREIVTYLTNHYGPSFALRVEDDLFGQFDTIAQNPGFGHTRSDLTSHPLLFFAAKPYLIVYRRNAASITVVAVLHSARDIRRLLRTRV